MELDLSPNLAAEAVDRSEAKLLTAFTLCKAPPHIGSFLTMSARGPHNNLTGVLSTIISGPEGI